MRREPPVRIREGLGVQLPRATRLDPDHDHERGPRRARPEAEGLCQDLPRSGAGRAPMISIGGASDVSERGKAPSRCRWTRRSWAWPGNTTSAGPPRKRLAPVSHPRFYVGADSLTVTVSVGAKYNGIHNSTAVWSVSLAALSDDSGTSTSNASAISSNGTGTLTATAAPASLGTVPPADVFDLAFRQVTVKKHKVSV